MSQAWSSMPAQSKKRVDANGAAKAKPKAKAKASSDSSVVKKRPSAGGNVETGLKRRPAAIPVADDQCTSNSAPDGTDGSKQQRKDNCVLLQALDAMFKKMTNEQKAAARACLASESFKAGLHVGTIFSGSEVQCLAGSAVTRLLSPKASPQIPYYLCFSCDNDSMRQKWLTQCMPHICPVAHSAGSAGTVCCFADASGLGAEKAWCVAHGGQCRIPSVTICIAGFSCKDLSTCKAPQNTARKSVLNDPSCSTGRTFQSLKEYLREHQPPIYLGENLDELAETGGANHMDMIEGLAEVNYTCEARTLQSCKYGSPSRRERAFIVAMCNNVITRSEAIPIIKKVFDILSKLQIGLPSVAANILLPSTDPYILEKLAQLQKSGNEAEDSNTSWRAKFDQLLASQNLRYSDCAAPAECRGSPWFAALPIRAQANLGYIKTVRPAAQSADVGQTIGRSYVSDEAVFPTMLPNHKIWDYSKHRLVTGLESMMVIGFDRRDIDQELLAANNIKDHHLRELAGNAFTGQIIGGLLLSLFAALPLEWLKSLPALPPEDIAAEPISEEDEAEVLNAIFEAVL